MESPIIGSKTSLERNPIQLSGVACAIKRYETWSQDVGWLDRIISGARVATFNSITHYFQDKPFGHLRFSDYSVLETLCDPWCSCHSARLD